MTHDYSRQSVPGGVCSGVPLARRRQPTVKERLLEASLNTDRREATNAVKQILEDLDRDTFRKVARAFGVKVIDVGPIRKAHRKALQAAIFSSVKAAPEEPPTTFKRVTHAGITVMPSSGTSHEGRRSEQAEKDPDDDGPSKKKAPEHEREAKQHLEAILAGMNLGEVSVHSGTEEVAIGGRRKKGYELYYIPKLKTGVLISNIGGKTFFIYELEEEGIEEAMEMKREEIMARKAEAKSDDLIWNSNLDKWESGLKEKLRSRPNILRSSTSLKGNDAVIAEKGDEDAYHKTPGVIKHDVDILLAAFPGVHHEEVHIVEVLGLTNILCADGVLRSGREIFSRAGCALVDDIKQRKEVYERGNLTKIWRAMLKKAGYRLMDEDYFRDPVNLRADLLALAKAQGHNDPRKIVMRNKEKAACASGRKFVARTYMHTAYVERKPGTDTREADKNYKAFRDQLIAEAGLGEKMDLWYMSEHLPHDLEACAGPDWRSAGLGVIRRNRKLEDCTPCHNGETLTVYTLLNRARLLGLVDGKKVADWRELVEIAKWLEQVNPEIARALREREICREIPLEPGPQVSTGWTATNDADVAIA